MRLSKVAALLLLAACSGGEDKATDTEPGTPGTGDRDCAGEAPVIESVTIEDYGLYEFESGTYPAILITASITDEDGDLDYYEMQVFYDDEVDDSIDTSEDAAEVGGIPDGAEECEVDALEAGMVLAVNGNPPYETRLEFGVRVSDYNGDTSDLYITTFRTPDEDGSYDTETSDSESGDDTEPTGDTEPGDDTESGDDTNSGDTNSEDTNG